MLISQALLSGLTGSSPGEHMKPNPTGMRIHSLAQRKGAGGEQQTSTRGIPRQLQVRGKGAELCQSSHPRTSGHSPSSAGSTEQPERKQLPAAEPARTRRTLGKAAGVQAERLSAGRHARQRKHRLQQRRGRARALPPQQSQERQTMAGASSRRYRVTWTLSTCPAALALSFYQRSGHLAFQHAARTSWHSSTLAPESPAPPVHRVTAEPGRFSPNTAGPARCWAHTWVLPFFHFLRPSAATASSPSL